MKSRTVKSARARMRRRLRAEPVTSGFQAISSGPFRFARHVRALTAGFAFTAQDMADILDVDKRTITRWKAQNDSLSPQQIDRIHVLESILDLGKRVLGSDNEVRLWLNSPVFSLEGQQPIKLLKTESGRKRVENVLLQIEAGVY